MLLKVVVVPVEGAKIRLEYDCVPDVVTSLRSFVVPPVSVMNGKVTPVSTEREAGLMEVPFEVMLGVPIAVALATSRLVPAFSVVPPV